LVVTISVAEGGCVSEQELNSKMEFIVEQQAKFSIDIEKLKEAQEELTKKHNNLTDALTTVVGVVGKLAQAQENLTINQEKHSKYCSPKVC
jgi:hypothetical protein